MGCADHMHIMPLWPFESKIENATFNLEAKFEIKKNHSADFESHFSIIPRYFVKLK